MRKPPPKPSADIYARIRAALPTAGAVIARGIDPDHVDGLDEHYAAVAGGELPEIPSDDLDVAVAYVDAVFVLGMAVGLLLDKQVLALDPPISTQDHSGPTSRDRATWLTAS